MLREGAAACCKFSDTYAAPCGRSISTYTLAHVWLSDCYRGCERSLAPCCRGGGSKACWCGPDGVLTRRLPCSKHGSPRPVTTADCGRSSILCTCSPDLQGVVASPDAKPIACGIAIGSCSAAVASLHAGQHARDTLGVECGTGSCGHGAAAAPADVRQWDTSCAAGSTCPCGRSTARAGRTGSKPRFAHCQPEMAVAVSKQSCDDTSPGRGRPNGHQFEPTIV
mmetsp:Transcript_137214/g.342063  ORF Transcript_137214/g.342063 Transcript_137214/m.342063 type:complete len:224 (+) Transcript_137214:876-1547(+)